MRTAAVALGFLVGSSALAVRAPSLDGFVNDLFWAEKGRAWVLYDPDDPHTVARCFLGFDEQYLYFAADVSDTNVIGTHRTVKSRPWEDDAIKLLVHVGDPQATHWTQETFSYTFSATGGITWARGPVQPTTQPAVEPGWPPSWDSAIKWAVGLKPGTTPNAGGSPDSGYAVEARIPWSELGIRAPSGPRSTINVCIVDICRPEMSLPEGKPITSVSAIREITPSDPSTWQRVRMSWNGPLATRGLVEPLPLWLGSPAGEYQIYAAAEGSPDSRWWDRRRWSARLDRMRVQNLNTLVLRHTNPWSGLLAPASAATRPAGGIKEAIGSTGWFTTEEFAKVQDQFRWILAEAQKNGIRTYLLFSDEQLSTTEPTATRPDEAARDEYRIMSQAARQFMDIYPALAGLAAGSGFNSPDMLKALTDGMSQAATTLPATATQAEAQVLPELLIWTDGIEPAVVAEVSERFPQVRTLHTLHQSHWYKPLSDAGIQRFNHRVEELRPGSPEPLSSMAMGSLKGPFSYVFWNDPQWARALTLDLRTQGIEGFLLDSGFREHNLAREALFEYAYNAGQRFSRERWESRLQVYGVGEYAGQLLEAMQHASAIIPQSLLLLNDSSPRFMPQFGLLLVHYTELPVVSVKDNIGPPDLRAELLGRLGVAWPDLPWGKEIAGVRAEVKRTGAPDAISAWEIIANLGTHIDACNSLLPGLRHVQPNSPEQSAALNTLLDSIELNVALGEHIQNKLKAAIGWEQYKRRRGRAVNCTQPLQQSVAAWERVADISDRLYGAPVEYWQSQPVSAPPWDQRVLQQTYVPVSGKWRDQLRRFQRELNLIRSLTSGSEPVLSLPLWDHVNAVPEEKRQTRFVFDFEQPDDRVELRAGAAVVQPEGAGLSGKMSLLVDTRELPPGRHEVFATHPGHVPLVSAVKYQISFVYRVVDPGAADHIAFEAGVRHVSGGEPLGDHRTWTAPAEHTGSRILQVPRPEQDGNVFYIATTSPAAILIDTVHIAQVAE